MTLSAGVTFGPYEIVAPLGAGGMGEVYRARDSRLGREVAIKVLPQAVADDPERVTRLTREAKVLASMSHPNIAAIYGVEERDGRIALVLELVEGPTLAERLASGPVPMKTAITIALQIAQAVEAAHARGIIHRDLKPANLKITPDGRVKVLDFGVAKVLADNPGEADSVPVDGTLTTRSGVVIGTPGYMSPEQATGTGVDRRADIWALGCVCFEMLAGRRPFAGATASETLVRVLEHAPEWKALPSTTPLRLAQLIERCLRKDARQRLQDIGDFRVELEDLVTGGRPAVHGSRPGRVTLFRRWLIAIGVFAIAAVVLLTLLTVWRPKSPALPPIQLAVLLPVGVTLPMETGHSVLALSPDGTQLVFIGEDHGVTRLYKRALAGREAQVIPGTEGAGAPFFSPDGKWVAFFDGSMLKRVALAGGVPIAISGVTEISVSHGAAWIAADTILLSPSANSGLAVQALTPGYIGRTADWKTVTNDTTGAYAWPDAVPGTPFVVFADHASDSLDRATVSLFDRRDRTIHKLLTGGTSPLWSPPDQLLFVRGGTLYADTVDVRHARAGTEYRLFDNVISDGGAAHVAVSRNGTLAYVAGAPVPHERELVWVDRRGNPTAIDANGRDWSFPRLSPDGSRLAVTSSLGPNSDVYVLALKTLVLDRITTHPGEDFGAAWSPDGLRLAFSSEQFFPEEGPHAAWQPRADGRIELLMRSPATHANWDFPTSWSPDGKWIAYTRERDGNRDVEVIPTSAAGTSQPFVVTPSQESAAIFSPDGRFIAYVSDASGDPEVYVQPFPGPGARKRISVDGGTEPLWNRNTLELFYRRGDDLMSVQFDNNSVLEPRKPTVLFTGHFDPAPYGGQQANYDVSTDGSRFVFVRRRSLPRPTAIQVIVNWPAAIGRR